MKFVIFGLTVSSSWGNGHATLWRGLWRALARRGHHIVFFERDVAYYAAHRDLVGLAGGELVLYPSWELVRHRVARELGDADVAMVTSYCPDGAAASDAIVESASAAVKVFYDMDTPMTFQNLREGRQVPYIGARGLGDFDLALSYTGGRCLEQMRSELGARRVATLYGHVDPQVHTPVAPSDSRRCALSYLGTYAADRQSALEALFVQPATRLPECTFVVGGSQYPPEFVWPPNVRLMEHTSPPEHPAFFCSSRLTLSVTRGPMAENGYCPSGRLFEAAACGTPIVSDWWPGIETFLEPGREVVIARSAEDVIESLAMSDAELLQIASAARKRVLSDHTSERRAQQLEQMLDGNFIAAEPSPMAAATMQGEA
jgi:spore maturation protein CgeB